MTRFTHKDAASSIQITDLFRKWASENDVDIDSEDFTHWQGESNSNQTSLVLEECSSEMEKSLLEYGFGRIADIHTKLDKIFGEYEKEKLHLEELEQEQEMKRRKELRPLLEKYEKEELDLEELKRKQNKEHLDEQFRLALIRCAVLKQHTGNRHINIQHPLGTGQDLHQHTFWKIVNKLYHYRKLAQVASEAVHSLERYEQTQLWEGHTYEVSEVQNYEGVTLEGGSYTITKKDTEKALEDMKERVRHLTSCVKSVQSNLDIQEIDSALQAEGRISIDIEELVLLKERNECFLETMKSK